MLLLVNVITKGITVLRNFGVLEVKITLTLVVLLSISLFSLTTQGITTGTSSDLSRKCGSPLIKVTLTELSISNLRHVFTSE